MDFEAVDDTCGPLGTAMANNSPIFSTARIEGTGEPKGELVLPYAGKELRGAELEAQCDRWADAGTMEPDCAAAVKAGAKQVGDLKSRTFVVLGAGSELGPVKLLLEAGATVAAVATRKPARWSALIEFARQSAGTLLLPVAGGALNIGGDDSAVAQQAGADLSTEAPAVAEWAERCAREAPGPVTVATYLYVDGEANVRVTVAADYIIEQISKLGKDKVSFAWLASCSTTLVLPEGAVEAQQANLAKASWWQRWTGSPQQCEPLQVEGSATPPRLFRGFEVMQGPNYALAQSMRQWRAMLLHAGGFVVSTPVTPMCRTESVCHNSTMATLLDGVAYTAPMEAFEPEACRAAMLAVLISDLTEPVPDLPSPFYLFARKSFHSGLWRCPYKLASLGTMTWVLGKVMPKKTVG
mmetsp:Transcript_85115/g.264715  ORF Transcript_85115/g.264715 Transcript_85115/m.264715 type:complete len:411 (+) Transcript_85115:2-1234(+)